MLLLHSRNLTALAVIAPPNDVFLYLSSSVHERAYNKTREGITGFLCIYEISGTVCIATLCIPTLLSCIALNSNTEAAEVDVIILGAALHDTDVRAAWLKYKMVPFDPGESFSKPYT